MSLESAMKQAYDLVVNAAERAMRLLMLGRRE
jgi:hypothetical protein